MSEFERWISECSQPAEDNFKEFYRRKLEESTFSEVMIDHAWQLCQLQVCVEGILTDMRFNGQKDQKVEEED